MKTLTLVLVTMISMSASAAKILDGSFNSKTQSIDLDVAYGGGCEVHTFTLDIGACQESFPVRCPNVQLIEDKHGDNCKAYIQETISISLEEAGIDGPYYTGATFTIHGDINSRVTIVLPREEG